MSKRLVIVLQIFIFVLFATVFVLGSRPAKPINPQGGEERYLAAETNATFTELERRCGKSMKANVAQTRKQIEQAGFRISELQTAKGMMSLIINAKVPCEESGSTLVENVTVRRYI